MKWKNYGLWVSMASLLYMLLKDMGFQIDLTQWQTYVTGVLGILVALGVLSNPENGKGYFNAKIPPTPHKEIQTEIPNNSNIAAKEPNSSPNQANKHGNHMVDSSTTETTTEEIVHDRKYTPYEK